MRLALLILSTSILLTACLELTPKVSTDFSETEARAVFEDHVRKFCDHRKSRIPGILSKFDNAQATPITDRWIFNVEGMEALVFPSGVVAGPYIDHLQANLCG